MRRYDVSYTGLGSPVANGPLLVACRFCGAWVRIIQGKGMSSMHHLGGLTRPDFGVGVRKVEGERARSKSGDRSFNDFDVCIKC